MTHLLLIIIYLAFVSLGLPDSLLGASWPAMYPDLGLPVSAAGILSMMIAGSTIVSSLLCDRLARRYGTEKLTLGSVLLVATGLLGFSVSNSFLWLILFTVPYGLGAGSIDAALNNYVALHYTNRDMSWLHCMWGVGASLGPVIVGQVLAHGKSWKLGYRYVGLLELGIAVLLVISLPVWQQVEERRRMQAKGTTKSEKAAKARAAREAAAAEPSKPLRLRDTVRLACAPSVLIAFFCYCGIEQTAGLWASSYLVLRGGLDKDMAAGFAGLFFMGITAGRFLTGFLAMKLNHKRLMLLGLGFLAAGVCALFVAQEQGVALLGLAMIGFGCAPLYPSMIHATPLLFGKEHSQAMIGVQTAAAYVGTCLIPPLFGLLSRYLGLGLFPFYLLALLVLMAVVLLHILKQKKESFD